MKHSRYGPSAFARNYETMSTGLILNDGVIATSAGAFRHRLHRA